MYRIRLEHLCTRLPILLFLWASLGSGCTISSSSHSPKTTDGDSLLTELRDIKYQSPAQALEIAQKGLDMAEASRNAFLEAEFLGEMGSIYRVRGRYTEAFPYYERAMNLAQTQKDTLQYARWLGERGFAYTQNRDYPKALEDITASIILLKQLGNIEAAERDRKILTSYIDLLQLYSSLEDFEKSTTYADSCRQILLRTPDDPKQARLLEAEGRMHLYEGITYRETSYLEKAIRKYRESCDLYLTLDRVAAAQSNYINIAGAFEMWASLLTPEGTDNPPQQARAYLDSAFVYLEQHMSISRTYQRYKGELQGLRYLSALNQQIGEVQLAKHQLLKALRVAGDISSVYDSALVYWRLGELYETIGRADSAVWYYKEYDGLNDRVSSQNAVDALQFAEAGFETEKKELENQQIRTRARLRLRNTLIITLSLLGFLLAVAAYYFQRNRHQKRLMAQQTQINQQVVVDLIKEQAIESLNARIEGQEKERKRIARELHDQVGGTLAAAKLSLEGLQKRVADDAGEEYQQTHELLKMAYQETRQLSHDMMALPLKNRGLVASAEALCQTLTKSGKLKVHLDKTFKVPLQISPEAGLHIYRILQELLQNIIKHAQATQVFVQVFNNQETFTLIVEDNGRGFPAETASHGMGLSNIKDRATHLKGTLEIDSQPGRGATIIIEIPANV